MARFNNANVAVKIVRFEIPQAEAEREVEQEMMIMKSLPDHGNVMKLLAFTRSPVYLVTDYMPLGTLSSYLEKKEVESGIRDQLILGTAKGMEHLHEYGIIHRDLAARNILLDASLSPRIADFGLSRVIMGRSDEYARGTQSSAGPLKWMAPEALTQVGKQLGVVVRK